MDSITEDYTNTVDELKNGLTNIGNNIDGYKKAGEKWVGDNSGGIQAIGSSVKKTFDDSKENISRAGREILRQAMEQSATPEAITGAPGGVGFGSNS